MRNLNANRHSEQRFHCSVRCRTARRTENVELIRMEVPIPNQYSSFVSVAVRASVRRSRLHGCSGRNDDTLLC